MDRLQGLIFSFYREDLVIKRALLPLLSCKMTRLIGVIDIECRNAKQLFRLLPTLKYLKAPIGLMRMAKKIVIHSADSPDLNYSVQVEPDKNLYV